MSPAQRARDRRAWMIARRLPFRPSTSRRVARRVWGLYDAVTATIFKLAWSTAA